MNRPDYEKRATARWLAKVQKFAKCWIWMGACRKGGYGAFGYLGKIHAAHRWGYERFVGPIPDGRHLHHVCDQPRCVNPAHLLPLTQREHHDMTARWVGHKTHCKRGHHLDDARINGAGARVCRSCERLRDTEKRRARSTSRVVHP